MSIQEPVSQPGKDRVHIWSIDLSLWPYFIGPVATLIGIYVIASCFSIYSTYNDPSYKGDIWLLIVETFKNIGPIGLSSATIGYFLVGGAEMAKSYLEYRREKRAEAERRAQKARRDAEDIEREAYNRGIKEGRKIERREAGAD